MSAQTVRPTPTPTSTEPTTPEVSEPQGETTETTATLAEGTPAPASAEAESAEGATESSESTEASGSGRSLRPRIGLEAGYSWFDLSNNSGLDHGGPHFRLEGGIEVPFADTFFAQANAFGSFAWGEHDLGFDTTSAFNTQTIGLNGRLGLSLLDDNFRITAGAEIGATHVGADSCEDGLSCGVLFTRNAQLYGMDTWGVDLGGEVGVSFLHGALGLVFRGGLHSGLNPTVDLATQPDAPAYGLNIPWMQVAVTADVMGLVELITGSGGSEAPADEAETEAPVQDGDSAETPDVQDGEDGETPETPQAGDVDGHETPSSPEVHGVALIEQHLATIQGEHGHAAQLRRHAEATDTAYQEYMAARGHADGDRLRVLALDVVAEARVTVNAYREIQELITQANRERLSLRGAEGTQARRLIYQMRQERNQLQGLVRRAYGRAQAVARQFNRATSGDRIELDFDNPVSGRRERSERPERPTRPERPERPTVPERPAAEAPPPPPPPPGVSLPPTPEGE